MKSDASPTVDIASQLEAVQERIALACQRVGRAPSDVTLIAVSKTHPAATVRLAIDAGARDLGKNRVAEAADKIAELGPVEPKPTWHLIGHLQSNKAALAVENFDVVHSIDSVKLIDKLGRLATRELGIFIQVNVSGEVSKEGIPSEDISELISAAAGHELLRLDGLMTIAPLDPDPNAARPYFSQLRELAQQHRLRHLSMGMTNDYEVAIEEGATHVRVGRAIFGERPS